ncbi:hypothetical protein V7S43_016457 [Phytophthora oleae]|uniref:Uncharacterized protein n=1 Tax=Phytophthora oleae TaxID=2107226 RepID=A0ABD3EVM1_9STRA
MSWRDAANLDDILAFNTEKAKSRLWSKTRAGSAGAPTTSSTIRQRPGYKITRSTHLRHTLAQVNNLLKLCGKFNTTEEQM